MISGVDFFRIVAVLLDTTAMQREETLTPSRW